MGFRTGLDWCGKSRPPLGFDPRTVQPVGSRYTDYATAGVVSVNINAFRNANPRCQIEIYFRFSETSVNFHHSSLLHAGKEF